MADLLLGARHHGGFRPFLTFNLVSGRAEALPTGEGMMNRTTNDSVEPGLGRLGLLLVALTGWAARRLEEGSRTGALAARLVLGGIMAVGWAADRLPGPDNPLEASRARRGDRGHRVQCDHGASV